jgi:quinol monooxygenase YgiN
MLNMLFGMLGVVAEEVDPLLALHVHDAQHLAPLDGLRPRVAGRDEVAAKDPSGHSVHRFFWAHARRLLSGTRLDTPRSRAHTTVPEGLQPRGGDVGVPTELSWRSRRQRRAQMLALWVKVRVKPQQRQRFLAAIEADALGSERDEPSCHRFNVLQDEQDENVYYFYEVYDDQAALEAHRAMPHYEVWRAAADTLDGPTEAIRCRTVFPAAPPYWTGR